MIWSRTAESLRIRGIRLGLPLLSRLRDDDGRSEAPSKLFSSCAVMTEGRAAQIRQCGAVARRHRSRPPITWRSLVAQPAATVILGCIPGTGSRRSQTPPLNG